MHCLKYFPAIALTLQPVWSHLCDIGKICPWGYGEVYTLSEANPDLSSLGRLFEVSQKFGECEDKKKGNPTAFDRVYTIIHLQFSGLGANGCELVFNVPCNNTTPIYHHGPIVVEAKTLSWPGQAPTWNNVVNANPPLIGTQVLGSFHDFHRKTFTVINPSVCTLPNESFSELAFIFETPESLHEAAELKFNQTVMNEDIVTGVYVNFTC